MTTPCACCAPRGSWRSSGVSLTPRALEAIAAMHDRLRIVSAERIAEELTKLLVSARPGAGLELLVDTGLSDEFIPELSKLRLEQDPVHRHKDVLRHTYAVVENGVSPTPCCGSPPCCTTSGKPATRQITPDGVQFHHHEVVGARHGAGAPAGAPVSERRHRRRASSSWRCICGSTGTGRVGRDSAVRRYVRDAGPLLDRLNQLTRADCTTRNEQRARRFAELQDDLEERIARLAEEENLDAMRPSLDGTQVMERLGLEPGPQVGEALAYPDGGPAGARPRSTGRSVRAAGHLGEGTTD